MFNFKCRNMISTFEIEHPIFEIQQLLVMVVSIRTMCMAVG